MPILGVCFEAIMGPSRQPVSFSKQTSASISWNFNKYVEKKPGKCHTFLLPLVEMIKVYIVPQPPCDTRMYVLEILPDDQYVNVCLNILKAVYVSRNVY
jgi:hypothetical protein